MNDLIKAVLTRGDLGLGPSIAVVIFFFTMLLICWRTFRPSAKDEYEKQAKTIID